ncbi:MAG TPA: DNA-formamidopyrimidine glycosylase family protein [candidate division Zixibacteria bacterium]|nr:DNA-formamidopyrimidine glycosylase family protein [candidate division Zixibacteria bacterium]
MFELPECITLVRQMNSALKGREITNGNLGNSPHKFVWYKQSEDDFARLIKGKTIGESYVQGRWIIAPIEPGYVLVIGECGGKVLFHETGEKLPKKYHLSITFVDGSYLTITTQMWGAMELYVEGEELERDYIKGMRTTPVETGFTYEYFDGLIEEFGSEKKRSAKSLLTQEQIIPGLGNAIAQDILYQAKLHPKHPIGDLDDGQRQRLYAAIVGTVQEAIEKGGRYDEYDLFGSKGGYVRIMDKNATGKLCIRCGGVVEKIQYLGGACYLCPTCQL